MREPRGIIGVIAHAGPASEKDRDLSTSLPKPWRLLPHDPAAIERLASALRLAPITAQLLLNRGLTAPDDCAALPRRPADGLARPRAAAGRLRGGGAHLRGRAAGPPHLRLRRLRRGRRQRRRPPAAVSPPPRRPGRSVRAARLDEGYGLNRDALGQIAATGVSLVVTVDCGIASVAEAAEAKRLGLELIVTDHHEYKETLPDAAVLVHPRLPGGAYPFGGLSGSAVALKLAWRLAQKASGGPKVTPRYKEFLLDAVALASLGVVADVVPLLDENRILVRYGLHRLREAPPLGVRALCQAAGIEDGAELRAYDVAFRIAPRLNAAGRLGCARLVVDLLTTTRQEQATDLARYLEGQNAAAPAAGAAHDDGGPAPGRGAGAAGRPGPGAGQRRLARRRHRHRGRPAGRVLRTAGAGHQAAGGGGGWRGGRPGRRLGPVGSRLRAARGARGMRRPAAGPRRPPRRGRLPPAAGAY